MAELAKKKACYEDLYSIPENMTGEIIDGELIATPRPSRSHVFTASGLDKGHRPAVSIGPWRPRRVDYPPSNRKSCFLVTSCSPICRLELRKHSISGRRSTPYPSCSELGLRGSLSENYPCGQDPQNAPICPAFSRSMPGSSIPSPGRSMSLDSNPGGHLCSELSGKETRRGSNPFRKLKLTLKILWLESLRPQDGIL